MLTFLAQSNETLRLQPPVPSGAQRSTQYTDGKMAGTQYVTLSSSLRIAAGLISGPQLDSPRNTSSNVRRT
jgi:hypothetical protein